MRHQFSVLSALLVAALTLTVTACAGDAPPKKNVIYVDTNGDGKPDAVDTDGDGKSDFKIPSCTTCQTGTAPVCDDPLVDVDGDGVPDGLDLDCDGNIDIPFDDGGGTDGSSQCVAVVDDGTTKQEIRCTSDNGGPQNCECKVNDQVVKTCTTTSDSACSLPGNGNCCGF
jgi:hypothetical protein